jgi:hypothetical protein
MFTVSFMPRREGRCGAALELKFHDHKRKMDFVIRRTLSGWAKRPANGELPLQTRSAPGLQSPLINGLGGDHSSVSTDDEEEEEQLSDTGISVSDEEGLNVGIVERRRPNGPFAIATSSLSIKLTEDFPAVTFLEENIRTWDRSDSAYVKTFSHVLWYSYS